MTEVAGAGSGTGATDLVVVFLHGHDDVPEQYLALTDRFAPAGVAVVAPRGPLPATEDTAAWFQPDADGGPDPGLLAAALDRVDTIVADACAEHAVPPERVVLGGFSQGGAVALAWGLRAGSLGRAAGHPRLAGVFCIAGWLPDAEGLDLDLSAPPAVPFLLAHGVDDEVIPLPMGRSVHRVLERSGWSVTFHGLECGHEFAPFADDLRTWLASLASRS